MVEVIEKTAKQAKNGPKFILNIEGQEYPWDKNTITTEEIAQLGGWDVSQGVIEVDKDNNERTLSPGETIEIKPGQGFGKKHRWKRGLRDRIKQELDLLRKHYPNVEHKEAGGEDWFLIPDYPFPAGWQVGTQPIDKAAVVFKVVAAYPTGEPYGFCAPAGINFKGASPNNTGSPVSPPFSGAWQHFSWSPEGWKPGAEVSKGQNLLTWVRGFMRRLKEGA